MSIVDVATLKARVEEFVAKAIAGEATLVSRCRQECRRSCARQVSGLSG
jgi:hypothetical protein